MKNKMILGTLSLLLCVTMAGCSSSTSTMTKTNISSQLDKTNNSIATVKSVSASDVEIDNEKLDSIDSEQKCEQFKNNMARAQATINAENYYKDEILYKTALIKKYLQKEDLKLKKGELNALKDLNANLSNYNDNVARSSNEFNATYRNYNTMKRSASRNIDRVNAKLNKITCNSNTRCSYYINILNTLQSMEDILGIEDYDYYNNLKENFTDNELENDIDYSTENNEDEKTEEVPNITNDNNDNNSEQNDTKTNKWKLKKNIDTYRNEENDELSISPDNIITRRNTDTYGPFRRNIDTYCPYGYGTYGMNGMYGMNGYGMNGMLNRGIYNNPYYNIYNSNNYNRLAEPVNTEMDEDEEKILNEDRMKEGIENSLKDDKTLKPKDKMKTDENITNELNAEFDDNQPIENKNINEIKDDKTEVSNVVDDIKENMDNTKEIAQNLVEDTKSNLNTNDSETKIKSVSVLKVEEIDDNDERVKAQ
ncbi:MAG TPA: hypothetical protein IAC38_02150 [Candidatus Caccovivens faecavium]|nr:hypothetical protein [Candidatus Caccovivens faecavium]